MRRSYCSDDKIKIASIKIKTGAPCIEGGLLESIICYAIWAVCLVIVLNLCLTLYKTVLNECQTMETTTNEKYVEYDKILDSIK